MYTRTIIVRLLYVYGQEHCITMVFCIVESEIKVMHTCLYNKPLTAHSRHYTDPSHFFGSGPESMYNFYMNK